MVSKCIRMYTNRGCHGNYVYKNVYNTCVQFEQYTAHTPQIARVAPAKFSDNFWGSVMPGTHNPTVVFSLVRSATKVNNLVVSKLL